MRLDSSFVWILFGVLQLSIGGLCVSLWPQPQSVRVGTIGLSLDSSSFKFIAADVNPSQTLISAFQRYTDIIFNSPKLKGAKKLQSELVASVDALEVSIVSSNEELIDEVDESYTLSINQGISILKAQTVYGALRGLETFSQFIEKDQSGSFFVQQTPIEVQDAPRFAWRGILVDTSRHFFPFNKILQMLDAMSYNKMNVFHWHVIDADSFPIVSFVYPELSSKGAYAPEAIYSREEVEYIIEYARLRGIRVVIEFDIPGHSSFGYAFPEIVGCPKFYNDPYIYKKQDVALDPTLNRTYEIVGNFLREMSQVFPDNYMHLGGDEVRYTCWEQNPAIKQFMDANGIPTYADLERYFWARIDAEVLSKIPKTYVLWDDGFVNQVPIPKGALLHIWQQERYLVEAVRAGNKVIRSQGWYLDQQTPGDYRYRWLETWIDFYELEPVPSDLSPDEAAFVVGGEACMWTEQVDKNTFDTLVWPRTSATAERLWSPQNLRNTTEAGYRLMDHRCRMVLRGIGASPVFPDYCERILDNQVDEVHIKEEIDIQIDIFDLKDNYHNSRFQSILISFLIGVGFTTVIFFSVMSFKKRLFNKDYLSSAPPQMTKI